MRRARAVFQDLCNNLVDLRGFTHQKLNAGDSKEHYTQPNLEFIPTEVNGNDFGPPTLLGHIESKASASSRKPMPTASEPSATPMTVHLGYGRSVSASDTASFAPASAQHTHENLLQTPPDATLETHNYGHENVLYARRWQPWVWAVRTYIKLGMNRPPSLAPALFPRARLTTRLWSIQVVS